MICENSASMHTHAPQEDELLDHPGMIDRQAMIDKALRTLVERIELGYAAERKDGRGILSEDVTRCMEVFAGLYEMSKED